MKSVLKSGHLIFKYATIQEYADCETCFAVQYVTGNPELVRTVAFNSLEKLG
jgi:hypothetical protein